MGSVFDDFKSLWHRPSPVGPEAPDVDTAAAAEEALARAEDYRRFFASLACKELEEYLRVEIEKNEPQPQLGLEASAGFSFTQKGLRMVQRKLESMRRMLAEIANEH